MGLCETESEILAGPCQSQGRWVGPDGKVRCSLHQIQEFGHGSPLVKSPDYEVPVDAPEPYSEEQEATLVPAQAPEPVAVEE